MGARGELWAYRLQPSPGHTEPGDQGGVQEQGAIPQTGWRVGLPWTGPWQLPQMWALGRGLGKDTLVDRRLSRWGYLLLQLGGTSQSRAGGERGPQVRGSRRAKAKEIMQGQLVTVHSSQWNVATPPSPLELHMALPTPSKPSQVTNPAKGNYLSYKF